MKFLVLILLMGSLHLGSVFAQDASDVSSDFSEQADDQVATGFVPSEEPAPLEPQTDSTLPIEGPAFAIALDSGYVEGFGRLIIVPQGGRRMAVTFDSNVCHAEANLGSMYPRWACTYLVPVTNTGEIQPSPQSASLTEASMAVADDGLPLDARLLGTLPGGFEFHVERRYNRPPRAFVIVDRRALDQGASISTEPTAADLLTVELHPNVTLGD